MYNLKVLGKMMSDNQILEYFKESFPPNIGSQFLDIDDSDIAIVKACLKLLYDSHDSSTLNELSVVFVISPVILEGYCSAYTLHLGSTWYGLLPSLFFKVSVPLNKPIPVKTSSNSLCHCFVGLALALTNTFSVGI